MFKTIKNIGVLTLIIANIKLIARLGIIFLLFIAIEIIYAKWQDPSLALSDNFRKIILYFYTAIQISLTAWFVVGLRHFVWGEKAKKVVEAKKSFETMSYEYRDIEDIDKHPNLK